MAIGPRRFFHILHMVIGLAILAGIVLTLTLMGAGDKWGMFIDPPSIIWVGGIIIGGLWLSFGPTTVLKAFHAAFSPSAISGREACTTYILVFTRAYGLAWAAGLLGMLVGIMIMLQNMDDPSYIGAGTAVAFVVLLYAGLLGEFVFIPLRQVLVNWAVQNELDLPVPLASYRSVVGILTGVAFAVAAGMLFVILSLS
ncbi:MAG: hypothetical protein JXL80_03605 [Planctomycetes bacterium]|nr:hypothetical protein [Planctomycetota bacterium]